MSKNRRWYAGALAVVALLVAACSSEGEAGERVSEAAAITEGFVETVGGGMLAAGAGADGITVRFDDAAEFTGVSVVATCHGVGGVATVDIGGNSFDVRCEKKGEAQVLAQGLDSPAGDLDLAPTRIPSGAGWSVAIYAPNVDN